MPANMITHLRRYGETYTVVALHTAEAPSDSEWADYVARVREMRGLVGERFNNAGGIAITDGGAPNARQRAILVEAVEGYEPLGAVVTDNILVRGVVSALSWFKIRVRSYKPNALDEAFDYLGIPPELHATARRDILDAAKELGATVNTVEKIISG